MKINRFIASAGNSAKNAWLPDNFWAFSSNRLDNSDDDTTHTCFYPLLQKISNESDVNKLWKRQHGKSTSLKQDIYSNGNCVNIRAI